MYTNISYFKSLNSLRFIAAYLVLIHHSEGMKVKNGISRLSSLSVFENGSVAVSFFFVLSGFLITYFLLKERNADQDISVRKFYLKRLFRIYPLYYLLVFFATLVLPFLIGAFRIDYDIPYTLSETWYFFVFFLPILVTYYYGHHLLEPLWSIGVEEVFYLFWAPLFKFAKRNVLVIILLVIILKIILLLFSYVYPHSELFNVIVRIYSIESMAIGGLGAYIVFMYKKNLSCLFIYKPVIQYLVYGLLLVYLVFNNNITNGVWNIVFKTPIVSELLVSLFFLYLIIGTSIVENSIINFENKFFSYLGKISYGIYMYHTTVISVVILFLNRFIDLPSLFLTNLLFYIMVTIAVLLLSHLSYKYFESVIFKLNKG